MKRMPIDIVCDICGVRWMALAPVGAIEAKCPGCGHFMPIPGCWEATEAAAAEGGDCE